MLNQVKVDYQDAKLQSLNKSFEYGQLESVKTQKEQIIANNQTEQDEESSYLLSTPGSVKFNLDSDQSVQDLRSRLMENDIILGDLQFDLKSEQSNQESKNSQAKGNKKFYIFL
jgi:hypothetical protein